MGDVRRSSLRLLDKDGVSSDTWRLDTHHFIDAYTAQVQHFVDTVLQRADAAGPTGSDARAALAVALACIESVERDAPVQLASIATL